MAYNVNVVFKEDVEYGEEDFANAHKSLNGLANGFEYEFNSVSRQFDMVGGNLWFNGYSFSIVGNESFATNNDQFIVATIINENVTFQLKAEIDKETDVPLYYIHDEDVLNLFDYRDKATQETLLDYYTKAETHSNFYAKAESYNSTEIDNKLNSTGNYIVLFEGSADYGEEVEFNYDYSGYSVLYFDFENSNYKVRHEVKTQPFSNFYAGINCPWLGSIAQTNYINHEFNGEFTDNNHFVINHTRIVGRNSSNDIVYQSSMPCVKVWGIRY